MQQPKSAKARLGREARVALYHPDIQLDGASERDTMFGEVRLVFPWIELDIQFFFIPPFNVCHKILQGHKKDAPN